jgi:hypothetical protein
MTDMRRLAILVTTLLALTACSSPVTDPPPSMATQEPAEDPAAWPDPPAVPDGRLEPAVAGAVERLTAGGAAGAPDPEALAALAGSGDARLAWLVSDLLRLAVTPDREGALVDAFERLTGADPRDRRFGANPWLAVTNLLIGWDLPGAARLPRAQGRCSSSISSRRGRRSSPTPRAPSTGG